MTNNSNLYWRAYEYICIVSLNEAISQVRSSQIIENSILNCARQDWNNIPQELKHQLKESANAFIGKLFDLEPMILDDNWDILFLKIQNDSEWEIWDVRDIVITRSDVQWEIWLSIKHNHFAVKHSRLSRNLDFGNSWYWIPCSVNYWNSVTPIFRYLQEKKELNVKWRDLSDKKDRVYIPLLNAFMEEIKNANRIENDLPKKLVEYLLWKYDFYKIISIDSNRTTQMQVYNLRWKLGKSSNNKDPIMLIPVSSLPTRIIDICLKPDSDTTVELYMDNWWQFSFRIHNASTIVEPSLKFDVQFVGLPSSIITINCIRN